MTFTPTDYNPDDFANRRHIGPSPAEMAEMLQAVGVPSLDALIDETVPKSIRQQIPLGWAPLTEQDLLVRMRAVAGRNKVMTSLIGQGYYGTVTPPTIQRNILENPAWYTSYTPYQPEISQGRLEALLNFQTMVADLTGLPVANASLLDEATAAAEAMTMAQRCAKSKAGAFFVDRSCHPQTIGVIRTRALPLGIEVIVGAPEEIEAGEGFRRDLPVSRHLWPCHRFHQRDRGVACGGRHRHRGCRPARDLPAERAGGDGGGYCRGLDPAFRRAGGLWRAACRLFRLQG